MRTNNSYSRHFLSALLFIVVGLVLLFFFFRDIDSWKILCPEPVNVQATVIRSEKHTGRSGTATYIPCVRFELDGREYYVQLGNSFKYRYRFPVAEGTLMTISVNSRRPRVVLKSPDLMSFIFGTGSLVMLLSGGILIICLMNGKIIAEDSPADEMLQH